MDDQSSKHLGTVISCRDTTMINSTLPGLSTSNVLSKHTMCIYPKNSELRHTRGGWWWCYDRKNRRECYTQWCCKECGCVPICPDD